MDPVEFTFEDTLRLVQYFNVTDNDLIDIKSGLPYPLLSFCIHKLLPADMIGFNDPSNQVVKKGIEETEKETCIFVPTGSTPEGLQVSFMAHDMEIIFSDTDMFVIPKYETLPQVDIYQKGVVEFNENSSPGRNINIPLKDDDVQHCYPGFVIMTPKDHFIPLEKSLKHVADFDAYTRQFLKDHNYGLSNKGPSLKLEVYHTDEYKNDIIGDSDYVYAFPSHDWPIQAKPWPTRHRPAKWPTEELIRDIIVLGTHYVKKPPPDVDESIKDYYWRISFSFAERELAKSFNDTQRQCAILLKLLKEKEIVPSEVLSSYHMKTIMYWACEEIPEKYWIPSNLGNCFITVIDRLYLAVATVKLPHYFIPELNLLANKPKCTLYSILKCLQKIRQSPLSFIGTLTSGYIVRHHIQLKPEGILTPTDDYIKTKIVEDFSKTFRDLLILCSCLLKVVHYRFKQSEQINILNEVLNTIDATTGIISIATTCNTEPFKTLYHDIKEMAALITFEDEDLWSFLEILNKMKSYETARTGQLLYHHLNEKHARNTIYIQTKTVFPVINMMLK